AKADVSYVDPFHPSMYGFNGFKKGVKPDDLAIQAPAADGAPPRRAQLRQTPPRDWTDPATGHRIIRLTGDGGGSSFYFHQNGYTATGDRLVISTRQGLAAVGLTTLGKAPPRIEVVVEGRAGNAVVGKKTRQVFYQRGNSVYATHLDT